MRRNQYRLMLTKSKLRRNLKTDHRKPLVIPPAQGRGKLRLDGGGRLFCGGRLAKGAQFTF
ncbi:MAG: hypothetical protein LBB83_05380, partial [Treponema sp.]|nr:hypothetical protein [Treponema sp.]